MGFGFFFVCFRDFTEVRMGWRVDCSFFMVYVVVVIFFVRFIFFGVVME